MSTLVVTDNNFNINFSLSANWKKLRAAGHKMSTILEEGDDGATKVVYPKQLQPLDASGDDIAPIVLDASGDDVAPIESVTEVEPAVPVDTVQTSAQFHVGSAPNIVFVLSEKHDLEKLNTFYVLLKDHVAVMVRNQSDATLDDLRSYLLQKYPDCGLVTPTFSADNMEKGPGRF